MQCSPPPAIKNCNRLYDRGTKWDPTDAIQTLVTPNVDPFVCDGHLCLLISPEGGIFLRELILKLVVQTLLSVLGSFL